jgi:hypothetical protein
MLDIKETKMLELSDFKKCGPKPGGSIPGGMYVDPIGGLWMVKFVETNMHAKNEVLACKLYHEAGVKVPQLELVHLGEGRLGVASRWDLKLKSPKRLTRNLAGLMEGFAVDAWLANWDVVGLEFDNILTDGKNAVRIDLGGTMLFRAQGAPKPFASNVVELMTLLREDINPQSAKIFEGLQMEDMIAGLMMLGAVNTDRIKHLVNEVGMPADVADVLIARREYILKFRDAASIQWPVIH